MIRRRGLGRKAEDHAAWAPRSMGGMHNNMSIVGWIILGGLAGWLSGILVRGTGLGIVADILVGIVGAFIGGLIVSAFGGTGITGFNLWSFIVAVIGAVVLLLVVRLFTAGRARSTV